MLPLGVLTTTTADTSITITLLCAFVFCASIPIVAAPTTLQVLVPNQMRAQLSAGWMLALNIISTAAGPTLVGFITEYVLQDNMAVGTSIAIVCCISVPIAGLLLWTARRSFGSALKAP